MQTLKQWCNVVSVWMPWIGIVAITGAVNVFVAWQKLSEDCKYLPFFRPLYVGGVWIWLLIQLSIPACAFWVIERLQDKPPIDIRFAFKAFLFGWGFVALMNSQTPIGGGKTLDLKAIYSSVVRLAYQMIATKHTLRTTLYKGDLQQELEDLPSLDPALTFLEHYVHSDISLTATEKTQREDSLSQVRNLSSRQEQASTLVSLMEVRRADLRAALDRFGCRQAFLQKYFPSPMEKMLS